MADQPRERLAGVNRVGQKPLGSRQKADRLVGRLVRLLIPRLEIAALNVEIRRRHARFAAQPFKRRIRQLGAAPLVARVLAADGHAGDLRPDAQRLAPRDQSGQRAARARRRVKPRWGNAQLRALLHHFQIAADKRCRADGACAAHRHVIAAVAFRFQPRRVRYAHLMAPRFRLRLRLPRQTGHDVHLRAEDAIQQHVRAHVVFIRLHIGIQVENRLHAEAAAGRRSLHGVVGLRRAVGEHRVAALLPRVAQQIFQLADLVAAEKAHAGKIVALDIEIHAQPLAQPVELIQRRREKAEVRARLLA